MDTDKYRSTNAPIGVSVESDRETVECVGEYSAIDGGFVLTFSIGDGKYEITHTDADTVLAVGGLLSYRISFASAGSVKVGSPYGAIDLAAEPISRSVSKDGDVISVLLRYSITVGGNKSERDVRIAARFI